ncbi:Fic family protein, partial [Streptococcus marmotae]
LERIHPFSDGNGRTGRLILMYLAMRYLKAPIIISKDDRAKYMELLANQDTAGLADLLKQSLDYEKERMNQF